MHGKRVRSKRGSGLLSALAAIPFLAAAFMLEGGSTATVATVQDLLDEKARKLSAIDDLLRTAREDGSRDLTDEELQQHDALVAEVGDIDTQITEGQRHERSERAQRDQDDRLRLASIRTNVLTTAPPAAERSLDELLWATSEEVPAGSIDRMGLFRKNPYGAVNPVDQIPTHNRDGEFVLSPRIDEFLPEHQNVIRGFQRTVADMVLFGFMVDRTVKNSAQAWTVAKEHKRMQSRWESVLRAMDVDTTAEGTEYVPTGLGAELHERVRASGKVAPLFPVIQLPTNPWEMPVEGADATAFLVPEPTSDTATKVTGSTPGSLKVQFDAEIFGARVLFSRSLDADSAIAILPFVRGKITRAFVDAEEKAILDGDTAGTHQDSDVTGATDARKAWDGLRKKGLAETFKDGGSVPVTLALYRELRRNMAKWGLNPADLAVIVPVGQYYRLLELDEVTTVDKFGPKATILNGQLGALDGIPVIVSEHGREDLNASGVHDGVTETQSYILIVNRGEWALGQRMALDIEVDDSIYRESFQRVVVGFMREDFQSVASAAANDDTAVLFNLDA